MSTPAIIRGLASLGVDATAGITDIVEGMYRNIAAASPVLGQEPDGPARGIAGLVHRCIRESSTAIGGGVDQLLDLAPTTRQMDDNPAHDAWRAALNGVVGDHLHNRNNPLAIPLQFRAHGLRLDSKQLAAQLPDATDSLLLLAHGLCMNDRQWTREGHSHASAVQQAMACTPIHTWMNTGRPIADNGLELAHAIEALVAAWPVPLRRIQLLGHSMGGLVLRSAIAQAEQLDLRWNKQVTHLVCLGTPHFGAPLERAGHAFNSSALHSPYTAPLGRLGWLRSAGITDLRHGAVLAAASDAPDRFAPGNVPIERVPLPVGIRCSAAAATLGEQNGDWKDRAAGDGLVPVSSALGLCRDADACLDFASENTLVVHRTNHWELLDDGPVRDFVLRQLADC